MSASSLYAGLMSGTSADGVDACLVRFRRGRGEILAHHHQPFTSGLRDSILNATRDCDLEQATILDVRLADAYSASVHALLDAAGIQGREVRAIGCHGQTVLHRPKGDYPTSIQLGDAHRLAVHTGIDVVADFRRADLAAGGEGAPLAPGFHAWLFGRTRTARVVVNIGGIANITILGEDRSIRGFDTGPGNVLLDTWCTRHLGRRFDAAGEWAGSGRVIRELLASLQGDDYFARPPPKSTGREHFNTEWLDGHLTGAFRDHDPADIQATLAELTARSIAGAILEHAPATTGVLVCGGGACNTDLMERLRRQLHPGQTVGSTAAHGLNPDHVEAAGFAWLARQRVLGRAGNIPAVTGATRAVVLGALIRAPR